MKSTDILDTLLDALDNTEATKAIIDSIDTLLSGQVYENFMAAELTPDKLSDMITSATPCLSVINTLDDQVLSEMTPELRSRILTYLDRLQNIYDTAISMVKDHVKNTVSRPKKPEEMTREELLAYIKEQLN